jgi:hypothetical protein
MSHSYRVAGRVLGCLNTGEITVIIYAGHGVVGVITISVDVIPFDLRMPNSEFDVVLDPAIPDLAIIVRKDQV